MRFGNGPNIGKPGDAFYSGEGRGGVAAVGAETEADRFAIFGERRGIDDEVDLRLRLVAAPEAGVVGEGEDARGAFGDVGGGEDVVQRHAGPCGGVWRG